MTLSGDGGGFGNAAQSLEVIDPIHGGPLLLCVASLLIRLFVPCGFINVAFRQRGRYYRNLHLPLLKIAGPVLYFVVRGS